MKKFCILAGSLFMVTMFSTGVARASCLEDLLDPSKPYNMTCENPDAYGWMDDMRNGVYGEVGADHHYAAYFTRVAAFRAAGHLPPEPTVFDLMQAQRDEWADATQASKKDLCGIRYGNAGYNSRMTIGEAVRTCPDYLATLG